MQGTSNGRGIGAGTPVRLTIGAAFGAVVFLLGVHPWAVAQVRGVVKQETEQVWARMELALEKRDRLRDRETARELEGIKLELRALRLEVRKAR